MPEPQQQDNNAGTGEPSAEDQEKVFFTKMESFLDGWLKKKIDEYRPQGRSRTGNGGTPSLPGIIMGAIFGGPANKQE